MSEKGALKNKKIEVIALVILAAFIVALGFLVYRYNKNKDFIYEKHLQENVITINSENITLKDFFQPIKRHLTSFYISLSMKLCV